MRRRRRVLKILLGVALFAFVALIYAAWPGRSTFTVSPETTYVTGPLDKDGYVDYVTALNERLSKGITPENNASVLIWKMMGPHPESRTTMPPEYYRLLGIEAPPETGDYFVRWGEDVDRIEDLDKKSKHLDRIDRPSKWPWAQEEYPEIASWLKRNEKPLAVLVEATLRPHFYSPLVPKRTDEWSTGLIATSQTNIQKFRPFAEALRCRAMLHLGMGKADDAWQDLLACHRLGRLVTRGGTMIEWLVGVAVEQQTCNADLVFLDHANISSDRIYSCWRDLQQLAPVAAVADKIDLGDRFIFLDVIMQTARQGPRYLESMAKGYDGPPPSDNFGSRLFTRSVDWDPAFRIANSWYDRCVDAARSADPAVRTKKTDAIGDEIRDLMDQIRDVSPREKYLMRPGRRNELIGNVMIATMLPAFDKIVRAEVRTQQLHRNMQIAFSLAAYRRDHNRYPEKLDQLVPKYLDNVPADTFTGSALIYRLEMDGYYLNSIGPDGVDDGGRGFGDTPPGDDICVRMPVPEPKGQEIK